MAKKKYRIDYRDHSRLTPKIVKNEIYDQKHRTYALNFGSAFRMLKESFNGDDREKKTPAKSQKTTRSKYQKRNKKLLIMINKYISDPLFSTSQLTQLLEIKNKIQLQLKEDCYNQKTLEDWVEKTLSKILHPPSPLSI